MAKGFAVISGSNTVVAKILENGTAVFGQGLPINMRVSGTLVLDLSGSSAGDGKYLRSNAGGTGSWAQITAAEVSSSVAGFSGSNVQDILDETKAAIGNLQSSQNLDVSVDGSTTGSVNLANGILTVKSGSTGNLTASLTPVGENSMTITVDLRDSVSLAGALTASAITASGEVKVGTLNVAGASTMGGNVDVTGQVSASSGLKAGGTLDVAGAATLKSGLTVTGSATLTADLNAVNATLSGDLNANDATLTGNLTAVSGAFSGDVNVTGNISATDATLSGDLSAVDATLTGNLSAVSGTFSGDVTVVGNLTVQGSTTTVDTQNLLIKDPLLVLASDQTGSDVVDQGLIFTRAGDNQAFIWDESADEFRLLSTAASGTETEVSGTGYADLRAGDIFAENNMSGSGNLQVGGTATVGGNATLNGTLTVAQQATLNGGLVVTGSASLTGNVSAASGSFTGTLTATEGLTAKSATLTGGDLEVQNGNMSGSGNLQVGGTSTFAGAMTVNASASFNNGITVTGDVNLPNGSISNAELQNNSVTVTAGTGLLGGGNVALGGTITLSASYGSTAGSAVEGNTTIALSGTANEIDVKVNGAAIGDGSITLGSGGTLQIGLPDNVTIAQNLTVNGSGSVAGDFAVTGNLAVNGNVTLGDSTSDQVTVTGKFRITTLTSADSAVLTEYATSASNFAGHMFYLSGASGVSGFDQSNKWYFNEGGIWHPSSFYVEV